MFGIKSGLPTGLCPRCHGTDIRVRPRSFLQGRRIAVGQWDSARVNDFVCVGCGLTESYVHEDDLDAIARKWDQLTVNEFA